jgi:hypothetical protein
MVKLNKSLLPKDVQIATEQDYRTDQVFSILKNDCYNKCYICESKEPTGLQVEHRNPDSALRFDWNNIFLSCYHCNHAKSNRYANILDCTQSDPEEYILLSISFVDLKKQVCVTKIKDADGVDETVDLLNLVYNGTKTVILETECENLRESVMKTIMSFTQNIECFVNEPDTNIKQGYRSIISKEVSRQSGFAAFKRKIVRDDLMLRKEFCQDLI